MFFWKKDKKKEEKAAPAMLLKENIKVNCKSMAKEQVIEAVGKMLVDSGYVNADYVDAMKESEKTFSTCMGNCLAMPHGVEAAKKEILHSGIAVMIFPEGVDWDGEEVKVVVGIAGVGEEHLAILANIAGCLESMEDVEKLVAGDADYIYSVLAN